jgi:glycosyltransferase involved in cell wall biosynthesis
LTRSSLRRPRLLLVTTVSRTLEAFLLPYAEHFRSRGWRVEAAAAGVKNSESCIRHFDDVHEMSWSRQPARVDRDVRSAVEISRLLRTGFDLVHVHTPVAAFIARIVAGTLGPKRPPIIYTAHGLHLQRGGARVANFVYGGLESIAGRWTDYLVVVNEEDYDTACSRGFVPSERVLLLNGIGIDLSIFDPVTHVESALRFRREIGVGSQDFLIGMVAEFTPTKRHEDVIAALGQISDPSIHLVLAGQGPLLERVARDVATKRIARQVHVVGFRADIAAVIAASQLVVLASSREGLPRSILEAQALGIPVVGTDVRGIRDLLSNGRGILVPVRSPHALACAINESARNPGAAKERARRARQKLSTYSLDRILREHEELYERALERQ